MSKPHKGRWRDDPSCQRKTSSADGLVQESCSTESEQATDRCAPDVRTEMMGARSRSSILAPHVGNCSRALLLSACDMQAPRFQEARRSVSEELRGPPWQIT
jgi:hypothetical protein